MAILYSPKWPCFILPNGFWWMSQTQYKLNTLLISANNFVDKKRYGNALRNCSAEILPTWRGPEIKAIFPLSMANS